MKLLKKPEVLGIQAKSNTTFYSEIKQGLMTSPVSIGANSVAWPEHEVIAINSARILGKSTTEIRTLVSSLMQFRKVLPSKTDAEIRLIVAELVEQRKEAQA